MNNECISRSHLCPRIRIIDQPWQCAIIWFHHKLQRTCEATNNISIVHSSFTLSEITKFV
jgi:hypothetical protein